MGLLNKEQEKQLDQIIENLDDDLYLFYLLMIEADKKSKAFEFLKQFIHKNINRSELIYEFKKCIPAYLFSSKETEHLLNIK